MTKLCLSLFSFPSRQASERDIIHYGSKCESIHLLGNTERHRHISCRTSEYLKLRLLTCSLERDSTTQTSPEYGNNNTPRHVMALFAMISFIRRRVCDCRSNRPFNQHNTTECCLPELLVCQHPVSSSALSLWHHSSLRSNSATYRPQF